METISFTNSNNKTITMSALINCPAGLLATLPYVGAGYSVNAAINRARYGVIIVTRQ